MAFKIGRVHPSFGLIIANFFYRERKEEGMIKRKRRINTSTGLVPFFPF